jgi:hypothetical protein
MVELLEGPSWSHPAATKITFDELYTPANHTLAKRSNSTDYQAATGEAHHCYLATLFFYSLSIESHGELKKKIHNNALLGLDMVPCTNVKVLQQADQYNLSYQNRTT